jgi:hypothetical protein
MANLQIYIDGSSNTIHAAGNGSLFNSNGIFLSNSTVNTHFSLPNLSQYLGSYFLHANGSWVGVGLGARVYQAFVANDSVNTTFTVTSGYTIGLVDVYYNGVHLGNTEFTQNGSTIVLNNAAGNGSIIEVVGAISTSVAAAGGANTQVQFNDGLALNGASGFTFNKTSNTLSIPGNITANGTVGANNQALMSNGAGTFWAYPSEVLLANGTATNVATVDISFAGYDNFRGIRVFVTNAFPPADATEVWLRFSADGVTFDSGATAYQWVQMFVQLNTSTAVGFTAQSNTFIRCSEVTGNGAAQGFAADITIFDHSNAVLNPRCLIRSATYRATVGMQENFVGGMRAAAQKTAAIRFLSSSGANIPKLTYAVYGIN